MHIENFFKFVSSTNIFIEYEKMKIHTSPVSARIKF